jgi:hypothetical protein
MAVLMVRSLVKRPTGRWYTLAVLCWWVVCVVFVGGVVLYIWAC